MGKPIRLARIEVERTIAEFSYSLQHAAAWLAQEPAPQGYVRYDPLGVVAVISPWNFPLMLPLRGIVPALLAGNTVLFKPSELTPRTAAAFVTCFTKHLAPCPLIPIYGDKPLGAALVNLPVSAVAFTGSTIVGKKIAASAANSLKHLSLELGGLDAAIVLDDAEISTAAVGIVKGNTANSGQVCSAAKRAFVLRSQFESFVAQAVKACQALRLGDPLDENTDIGPLVSEIQLQRVQSFVDDLVARGGKILCGGKRAPRKGFFFEPTIAIDIPKGARILSEEPFGPILPIVSVASVDEAVERANETDYGLTASIWTGNLSLAESLAGRLQVGSVSINAHVPGGPGTPWGGAKQSGLGRAKTKEGLREFTNVKFVRLP